MWSIFIIPLPWYKTTQPVSRTNTQVFSCTKDIVPHGPHAVLGITIARNVLLLKHN